MRTNARAVTGGRLPGAHIQSVAGVLWRSPTPRSILSGTESANKIGVPNFTARQAENSITRYDAVGPNYALAAPLVALREDSVR